VAVGDKDFPGLADRAGDYLLSPIVDGDINNLDIESPIQIVLRKIYQDAAEDLCYQAEKVREANEKKKAVRAYLDALRKLRAKLIAVGHKRGIDKCCGGDKAAANFGQLIEKHAQHYEVRDVEYDLCIPDRVPPARVNSLALLDGEIKGWDERLAAKEADSQLANFALQTAMADKQRSLEMMANLLSHVPRKWPP
jgi:RNase H-fold protein (predicted Holliday junction resolvase)